MKNIFFIVLIITASGWTENHYVRDGGTGDGSAWNNALDAFPSTLTRGDTYYLADGTYPAYVFNDAISGDLTIYIKKATVSNHGIETGWSSTYGDGQAVFTAASGVVWDIYTDHWDFNGAVGSDTGVTTPYGIVVQMTVLGNNYNCVGIPNMAPDTVDHVSFSYIHFQNVFIGGETPINKIIDAGDGFQDITFGHCLLYGVNWGAAMTMRGWRRAIIDNCWYYKINNKECLSSYDSWDIVIKNSVFWDIAGTGIIVQKDGKRWSIFNNIFTSPTDSFDFTDCAICNWLGKMETNDSILIYSNTFVNLNVAAHIEWELGTGNRTFNNIFYNCDSYGLDGNQTHDYNAFSGAGEGEDHAQINVPSSIFTNYSGNDFSLSGHTDAGTNLGAAYNTDILGNSRTVWDRGAYEYGGSPPASNNIFRIYVRR
jgi:hypothetical protein